MKINKFINADALQEPIVIPTKPAVVVEAVAEEDAPAPEHVDSVIFPASDRFKHMMSLIARDNKELYNRIVGLE